jgi:ribokinase
VSVTVFGSVNMDIVMRVARLPLAGETVAASSLDHLPGGKGANQATASARFGAATRMIGAVGTDAFGTSMLDFLAKTHVDIGAVARIEGPTGLAHVFVSDEGENQIVIVAGANGAMTAPAAWVPFGTARAVCLTQLEVPVAATAAMLASARAAGALTMLNTAPALSIPDAMLDDADLLILNETELAFYLGSSPPEGRDAVAMAARRLLRRNDQWVVVTLGGAGIVAVSRGEEIAIPAPRVTVVDTTGAGDTFCGVMAAALSEGLAMAEALRLACTAASLSVQRVGAAASMPMRDEIEAAMAVGVG